METSQLGTNATWNDAYCQLHDDISKIKSIFNHKMPYPNIEEKDGSIDSKSKASHSINIWNDNIDNEINDLHHVISITNKINIERYILLI